MSNDLGQALDWNSPIEKESEFIKLEKGTYDFEVINLEKGYFNGSDKMGSCPTAIFTLRIGNTGVDIKETLYFNTKAEWKFSQFFISLGMKKKGVPYVPEWNATIGKKGKLVIDYQKWNGEERIKIKEFLEPESAPSTPQNNTASTTATNTGFQMPSFGN